MIVCNRTALINNYELITNELIVIDQLGITLVSNVLVSEVTNLKISHWLLMCSHMIKEFPFILQKQIADSKVTKVERQHP